MSNPKLLTCRQMAERIQSRNAESRPDLAVTKFVVWDAVTRCLKLKPAFQPQPTPGQKAAGGATMYFTPAQERKIERLLLSRPVAAAVA